MLALLEAHPFKFVPGIFIEVRVDGLDGKTEVGRKAKSFIKMVVDHIRHLKLGVVNLRPRHHEGFLGC